MGRSSRTVLVLALVAAIGLATGCTPKISTPLLDAKIFIMRYATRNLSTGEPSPGYDAVPLEWNPLPNTIVDSKMPIVHVNGKYSTYPLHWSSGTPLLAVQVWDYSNNKPLLTATSDKTQILVPPEGAQHSSSAYLSPGLSRWYNPIENVFVTVPHELGPLSSQKTLDGLTIPITESPLTPGSQAQTLTVPVPSGLSQLTIVYGSGSVNGGFVLAVGRKDRATPSLLILHMDNGKATWVQCTDTTGHGTDLIEGQSASFACIGGSLHFTHAQGKIYYIDMWSSAPSVTTPEKINTLLDGLRREGPTTTQAPLQALLACEGGILIIGYPDVNWNITYYATSFSGEVIGHLYADATSITSFDSQGHRGASVLVDNARGLLSFPSFDLFENYTTLTGTSTGSADEQVFLTAARSFAEQALAAGNHHLTAEPVITVSSKQVQSGKMAVMMYIHTMDAMNSGDPDTKPMIVGELQYLRDHGATLSAAARKAVEDDISEWRNTIESAMNTPTETNYMIKVVADVDATGNINASSLQVYIDNAPVGSNFIPAAQFLEGMRSAWVTVAQAYASAESIAAAAKAP
jgi:hypothetical protein